MLGICFGGQVIALALGGDGGAPTAPRSAGRGRAAGRRPGDFVAGPWIEWHDDVFSVPEGFDVLAPTEPGPQLVVGAQVATQFHPEAPRRWSSWLRMGAEQYRQRRGDPTDVLDATRENADASESRRLTGRLVRRRRPPLLTPGSPATGPTRLGAHSRVGSVRDDVVVPRDYLTVVWFGLAALLLGGLLLGVASVLRPNQPNPHKLIRVRERCRPGRARLVAEPDPVLRVRALCSSSSTSKRCSSSRGRPVERYGTFGLVVMVAFIVLLLDGCSTPGNGGSCRWV